VGYEATYSFNRANLGDSILTTTCTVSLTTCTTKLVKLGISSDAHEATGDWVVSAHLTGYRIFVLGGGGVLIDQPTTTSGTQSVTRFVYVYGGGIERSILPRLDLRVQYRGNLYHAQDLSTVYTSSKAFIHTAEPMVGISYRF